MTLDLLLHLMCVHLLGLNSPNATFLFLIFNWHWPELVFPDVDHVLLSRSHLPFLLLTCGGLIATTACKPQLLLSFFPPLVWFLSPQAGICVMSVDSPQSPEEAIDAKHLSICQSKRAQSVLKKTSGHEAQWGHQQPLLSKG